MVPMPGSAGNHQVMNAQAMVAEGRAALVLQGPGLDRELPAEAARLMAQPGIRAGMARPEPNRAVALCLEDLAGHLGC
jgi:UDP-N-acetylglucosamine--N-acetylmuramyl-(pentapeptide) pyrophosphoryl-undecaprenol N-acetylglucosamine transferase